MADNNNNNNTELLASKEYCCAAFDTLIAYFDNNNEAVEKISDSLPEKSVGGLFVTWHINYVTSELPQKIVKKYKIETPTYEELRGCIGCMSKLSFKKGLPSYAIIAATEDSRFSPITKNELPKLSVDVNILCKFEDVDDPFDFEIGKHGVELRHGGYHGLFLPCVAEEQGWDKDDTIYHLFQKAGIYSVSLESIKNRTHRYLKDIKVTRFQSSAQKLTYQEYLELRKQ